MGEEGLISRKYNRIMHSFVLRERRTKITEIYHHSGCDALLMNTKTNVILQISKVNYKQQASTNIYKISW